MPEATPSAAASLSAILHGMDAGAVTLGIALARRLAACRNRHRLENKRRKKAKTGGAAHWFNWSNREPPFVKPGEQPGGLGGG